MAISIIGGLIKAGRGVVKIIKGTVEGDGEETLKGIVKVIRGIGRLVTGALTGEVYEGGETQDEIANYLPVIKESRNY